MTEPVTEPTTEPTPEPPPPSLIDRLALAALAAEEADAADRAAAVAAEQDVKYEPQWQEAALEFVRSSPLAAYFPVTWRLIDHNLPTARLDGTTEQVVVTADDLDEVRAPLRFVVTRQNGAFAPMWGVAIAGPPDMTGGDWLTYAEPISSPGDVGRWSDVNRPRP